MSQRGTAKRPHTRSQTKKARVEEVEVQEKDINVQETNVLEGLSVTKSGKFVKVDDKLLQRLQTLSDNSPETNVRKNPFENAPAFLETMKNGTPLSMEFLNTCSEERKGNPEFVKMAEIIGNFPLDWVALKNSVMLQDNWDYNTKVVGNPKVTDQNNSGRCWAFSFYNCMRYSLMRKYDIDPRFEFSESYLFFYDKIERSNLFLEYMWTLRNRNLQDPEVRMFTNPSNHMISDGGCYNYAINLVSKYGLVPKNIYGESFNCKVSAYMNETLVLVLNHMALEIFRSKDVWTGAYFASKKAEYMKVIYDLVVKFLGEPPKPTDKFTWTFRDVHGETKTMPNLTPEKFYRVVVQNNEDKIAIINDPRHPETYYAPSYSEYSIGMIGGTPSTYINLPMEEFKKVIYESLKNDSPVWFASDMGKCLDMEANTSDPNRFDYSSVLGYNVEYDKADRLDMLTSVANHAMVFNGVDAIEDKEGNVTGYFKWRVENSWSSKAEEDEPDHGYHRMSDAYMDKYVYMAVIDPTYFEPEIISQILENTKKGISYTYKYTDAFSCSSLSTACTCCKKIGFSRKRV